MMFMYISPKKYDHVHCEGHSCHLFSILFPQKRSTFYGIPSCHDMFMDMFLGKGHFSSTNTYAPIYATHGAGICTPTCAQNPKISCWSLFKKTSTMDSQADGICSTNVRFSRRALNPRPASPSGHHGLQLSLMAPCLHPERSFGDVFPCLRRRSEARSPMEALGLG